MVNPTERKQVGEEAVHIRDCRVRAEIYYLDSSTDYREYLPGNRDRLPTRSYDDLIRSDFSIPWLGSDPKRVFGWVAPAFLLLVAWLFLYFVYFVWESF